MSDIRPWLQSIGLEKYIEVLATHDIDLIVAPDLTEQDLEKLGLSLGHRRKFRVAAAKLRTGTNSSAVASTDVSPGQPVPAVERRQLTVVFIDLVGSTALGGKLDPEDLISLLHQYRAACIAAIGKYEGYIAQYLGDGILVYFGFPQAQEDAAERAVRAGLEILEKVGNVKHPDGQPLQARVGIATGLVVIGGTAGVSAAGEDTVVGDTPNLAARLQSAADPDSVLVGPSTYQLTKDFFEFTFFGEHAIRGFRDPVAIWKVLRESANETRFAAGRAESIGPIVGRDRELSFLYDSWQRAREGNGHVLLLVGEAGIGKSRLMEALAERVSGEPHRLLRFQCSPYHRNSVLFPFIKSLRQSLELSSAERIEGMLARVGRRAHSSTLLLAELLDVPTEDALSPLEMTPNQRKHETLAILEDLLLAPLGGPVLILLEDAHWSDETTQTFVGRLLRRMERERALVVITCRPELKTSWSEQPQCTLISCKPMGHEHCAELIRNVASRMQMDTSLVDEIVQRSDGVPLFAQELTKAVLDLSSLNPGAVPLTLQDSLMARLDRLGRAKDVAQIASVVGRQFSYAVLGTIAGASNDELGAALARLREAGLIFESVSDDDEASYSFNHSLVQEAAYESLSRSRRQYLHGQIADHLELQSAATGETEPTLIAYHYSRAGKPEKSFQFWLLAADRSGQRLAFAESVASLGSALAEAERIDDPKLRAHLRLEAHLKMGATLANHKGPQTAEAEAALEQARALALEVNARPQLFQATWGLYLNAARNQWLDKAKLRGEELLSISAEIGDEGLKFEALHHRWGFAYFTGQTSKILEYTAEALQRYDRHRHHRFSYVFAGHDPGTCAHCVRAIGFGMAGQARSVRPSVEAGLALAHSLQHPLSIAFVQSVACAAMYIIGDWDSCGDFAKELLQVSARYEFPPTEAVGRFMLGSADVMRGDPGPALKQMECSFEAASAYGFFGLFPGVVMVDALARADRNQEALDLTMRLLETSSGSEIGVFAPELSRLRGELVLRQSAANSQEAERHFRTALRMTEQQGAPVFRLRAGIDLAQLLAEDGRREEAMSIIDRASADGLHEWGGPEIAIARNLRSHLQ